MEAKNTTAVEMLGEGITPPFASLTPALFRLFPGQNVGGRKTRQPDSLPETDRNRKFALGNATPWRLHRPGAVAFPSITGIYSGIERH
jgi:hypothetical protein